MYSKNIIVKTILWITTLGASQEFEGCDKSFERYL